MTYLDTKIRGKRVVVRDPTPQDVRDLAWSARVADRMEVQRYFDGKHDTLSAVRAAIADSCWSRCGLIGGKVAAIFGLAMAGSLAGRGSPWCITSAVVESNPMTFLNLSRVYLEEMRAMCPDMLCVHVDADHPQAPEWLRWLGFTLEPTQINGYPFFVASLAPEREVACV